MNGGKRLITILNVLELLSVLLTTRKGFTNLGKYFFKPRITVYLLSWHTTYVTRQIRVSVVIIDYCLFR